MWSLFYAYKRNRLISKILESLESEKSMSLDQVGLLLEKACPYISAVKKTWNIYARNFAIWMDSCDLASLNVKDSVLSVYESNFEIRERQMHRRVFKSGMLFPAIQFSPISRVLSKIVDALDKNNRVNWDGMSKSSVAKALATLDYFGFIQGKEGTIKLLPSGLEFVRNPERGKQLFFEAALKMDPFKQFLNILEDNKENKLSLIQISQELASRIFVNWKDSTGEVYIKIMMDWARNLGLAPGVYSVSQRERLKNTVIK